MSFSDLIDDELVDRYLLNKMEDSERTDFEILMLANKEVLRSVEIRQEFINELSRQKVELIGGLDSNSEDQHTLRIHSGPTFKQWIGYPLSIAASLALVVSLLSLMSIYRMSSSVTNVDVLSVVGTSLTLESLRGGTSSVQVNGDPPFLLSIDSGPEAGKRYDVRLQSVSNSTDSYEKNGLRADDLGWLMVMVNQSLVGLYEFEVRLAGEEEIVSSYRLVFSE